MAAASARGGGRDRQRPNCALSIARAAGERRAETRARSRLSGRVCRCGGSKGGARRFWAWARIHYAPRASRWQRARRRDGQRAREHGVTPWLSVIGIGEAGILGRAPADCETLTLHGRPLDTLRLQLAPTRRILILAEGGGTPREVAALLTGLGWGPSRISVLAHLGGSRETIVADEARAWGDRPAP